VLLVAATALACGSDNDSGGYFDEGESGTSDGGGDGDGGNDGGDGSDDGGDSGDDGSDDSGGVKYDVAGGDDGGDSCECGLNLDFSYIWIANSGQGTVSKIDTQTLEELGRYYTRPDGNGNPSRTSVSFNGDVAVANRHAGLVKIYAQESDCVDSNGTPGIQTSHGASEILAWGFEECVAWYTEFPTTNQRPVAWAQGTLNPVECKYEDQKVWTVTSAAPGIAPGTGGFGGVIAYRVNGDTGMIEDEVEIPTFSGNQLGAYGGAVDADGNLWFSPMGGMALGAAKLARVDGESLAYEIFDMPANIASYGITVDHLGRVWVSSTLGAGAGRFDYDTETWDVVDGVFLSTGGLQEDAHGNMWIATGQPTGAVAVDTETLAVGEQFVTGLSNEVKGISIDVDGFVWVIDSVIAHRVDPATLTAETYDGLTSPYTYSDMTGWALHNTTCPPEG
jgi:hypothetical protein